MKERLFFDLISAKLFEFKNKGSDPNSFEKHDLIWILGEF